MNYRRGIATSGASRCLSPASAALGNNEGLLWYCLPFFDNPGSDALRVTAERNAATGEFELLNDGSASYRPAGELDFSFEESLDNDGSLEAQWSAVNEFTSPRRTNADSNVDEGGYGFGQQGRTEQLPFQSMLTAEQDFAAVPDAAQHQPFRSFDKPFDPEQMAKLAALLSVDETQHCAAMRGAGHVRPRRSNRSSAVSVGRLSARRQRHRGNNQKRRQSPRMTNVRPHLFSSRHLALVLLQRRSAGGVTGVTMRLRTVARKLLAGSGWIMDSSINKEMAKRLICELVGDLLPRLVLEFPVLRDVTLSVGNEREGSIEDILPGNVLCAQLSPF